MMGNGRSPEGKPEVVSCAGTGGKTRGMYQTCVVVVCLMIVLGPAGAATEYAVGKSVPVLSDYLRDTIPYRAMSIDNDRIVWAIPPDKSAPAGMYGIYLYNITTGETAEIATTPDHNESGSLSMEYPKISGDAIIWEGCRGTITAYTLTSGEISAIPGNAEGDVQRYFKMYNGEKIESICRHYAAISGDRVVWEQGYLCGDNWHDIDIYMLNRTTNTAIPVCNHAAEQRKPSVSGNQVVWVDYRNGYDNPDIYRYDFTTGKETAVCTDAGIQQYPVISGDFITWLDFRLGMDYAQIYLYDIRTGTEIPVTPGPMTHSTPFISGDRIAFSECNPYTRDPKGTCHGMVYDIRNGRTYRIPASLSSESEGVLGISGDRILFFEQQGEKRDLYLFTLANATPSRPEMTSGESLMNYTRAPESSAPVPGQPGAEEEPGFDLVPAIAAVFLAGLVLARLRRWL